MRVLTSFHAAGGRRTNKAAGAFATLQFFSLTVVPLSVILVMSFFLTGSIVSTSHYLPTHEENNENHDIIQSIQQLESTPKFFSVQDFERAEKESHGKSILLPPGYDVLDVGASKGEGSINFLSKALKKQLGAKKAAAYHPRTLGVDIDPKKVTLCRESGNDCLEGNILALSPGGDGRNLVGGITAWHVLEHMPSCDLAQAIWKRTSQLAKRFSLFHGPAFDDADILWNEGFHRFYENWTGHRCHFNSTMLTHAISESPHTPSAYIIVLIHPIDSSDSNVILPNGSSRNSHHYDPKVHPPKLRNNVRFSKTIYEEMRACAVYEEISNDPNTSTVGIDTALALKDVLQMLGNGGRIVSCHAPIVTHHDATSSCANYLEKLVKRTLDKAKSFNGAQIRTMMT